MFNVIVPFPKNAGNCNRVWIIGFFDVSQLGLKLYILILYLIIRRQIYNFDLRRWLLFNSYILSEECICLSNAKVCLQKFD